jgi:hypothetical protein
LVCHDSQKNSATLGCNSAEKESSSRYHIVALSFACSRKRKTPGFPSKYSPSPTIEAFQNQPVFEAINFLRRRLFVNCYPFPSGWGEHELNKVN